MQKTVQVNPSLTPIERRSFAESVLLPPPSPPVTRWSPGALAASVLFAWPKWPGNPIPKVGVPIGYKPVEVRDVDSGSISVYCRAFDAFGNDCGEVDFSGADDNNPHEHGFRFVRSDGLAVEVGNVEGGSEFSCLIVSLLFPEGWSSSVDGIPSGDWVLTFPTVSDAVGLSSSLVPLQPMFRRLSVILDPYHFRFGQPDWQPDRSLGSMECQAVLFRGVNDAGFGVFPSDMQLSGDGVLCRRLSDNLELPVVSMSTSDESPESVVVFVDLEGVGGYWPAGEWQISFEAVIPGLVASDSDPVSPHDVLNVGSIVEFTLD